MGRVLWTLALAGLAAVSAASTADPSRALLTAAFGISAADLAEIDRGQIVARTLEVKNGREIATLGVVRIRTTPESYVEHLRDIARFKRTDDILQIGTFSAPPREGDLAALIIEEADLNRFRECRVGECGVRLSAAGIERVRREIDWRAPDANPKTSRLLRTLLVEYVADYRQSGTAAAMEYAGTSAPLNVGREFAALVDADTSTWTYVPRLRRQLLDYPAGGDETSSGFIYWSKERVHHRPVVSITHVVIVAGEKPSPVTYAIGTKQIYATHYFDASLGVTLLLRDTTAPSPATYVVYLNRTRIDIFDGLLGGVARRIVAGRARSLVAEQLARIQRSLTDDVSRTASGDRESAAR